MRNGSGARGLLALLAVAAAGAGCGSRGPPSDAGPGDAPADAAALCGTTVCADNQLCVSQQNCGTQQCSPPPASGMCPSGTTATTCPATGQPGCLESCSATFSCLARPAGCATTVDCTCAMPTCAGGGCIGVQGNRVACAAP